MGNDVLGEKGKVGEKAIGFLSSIEEDEWLFEADKLLGQAHALMLVNKNIVSCDIGKEIIKGLMNIDYSEISGEDVHVAIESHLNKKIGEEKAGWLHTARSRNDEVATCLRMRLRDELLQITDLLLNLTKTLINKSKEEKNQLFPGFTHLQHAEPTKLGHHLSSYSESFIRDLNRLLGCYNRTNKSPLGAGALTTTSFDIDREMTSELLGFDEVLRNSIDAVSSRDFVIESLSVFTNIMTTISQLSEELILWNTDEFGFVELPDEYTSTSSIMPQKKNPDILELIRAKSSTVQGNLLTVTGILKSLPRAYNRDLQEIDSKIWNSIEIVKDSIILIEKILYQTEFLRENIEKSLENDKSEASELANKFVREKNKSFRSAHNKIGKIIDKESDIDEIAKKLDLTSKNLSKKDIVEIKNNIGAPSFKCLSKDLKQQSKKVKEVEEICQEKKEKRYKGINKLKKQIKSILDKYD